LRDAKRYERTPSLTASSRDAPHTRAAKIFQRATRRSSTSGTMRHRLRENFLRAMPMVRSRGDDRAHPTIARDRISESMRVRR
jgi:predicted ArsR family transcriptional regulator